MKNSIMENIKTMILEDSHRWDCPKYCGVVVVPKKYAQPTMNYLKEFTCGEEGVNVQRKQLKLGQGGLVLVREHKPNTHFVMDHCGAEYTSILCSSSEAESANMSYLMSRMRSTSEHTSKFLVM